jgi:hypothetical protein
MKKIVFSNEQIELLEHKYLEKFYHFLKYVEDDMLKGFRTKEKIKDDWIDKWDPSGEGKGISSFSTGAERIVYALINGKGVGQPNSAPVGADLFFEVEDAFIHIDLKTVQTRNIGDYVNDIFIGLNQNSYAYEIKQKNGKSFNPKRIYKPALPYVYNNSGNPKPCLTYFVTILYDEDTLDILSINLLCMPNGQLSVIYKDTVLKAGKTKNNIRFKFSQCSQFLTIDGKPSRIKVIYLNPDMNENYKKKLKFFFDIKETYKQY